MKQDSLADIARTCGLRLDDLARAIGRKRDTLTHFEHFPPTTHATWLEWVEPMVNWLPLLGGHFPYVLRSRAFQQCPRPVLDQLRYAYLTALSRPTAGATTFSGTIWANEGDPSSWLIRADTDNQRGWWDLAQYGYARLAGRYGPQEEEWAHHRYMAAYMSVNRGELNLAERLLKETRQLHEGALMTSGRLWNPTIQAELAALSGRLRLLRGEKWEAVQQFALTRHVARQSADRGLLECGWHMEARALCDDLIIASSFGEISDRGHLEISFLRGKLNVAQTWELNPHGSPGEAFNLWYDGLLTALNGRAGLISQGQRALQLAKGQFEDFYPDGYTARSHASLGLLHVKLCDADRNPSTLRGFASQLDSMIEEFARHKHPLVLADVLLTRAYCLLQLGSTVRADLDDLAETLCCALLLYPHPRHQLNKIGVRWLKRWVLPALRREGRIRAFGFKLEERVRGRDPLLLPLLTWDLDEDALTSVLRLLS